jgi:adenylyl- and sulfurtransferase ThiI
MTEYLFALTASQNYMNQALEEAREADKELKILQNYGNGILLAATKLGKAEFNEALLKKKPVFIRHICSFEICIEMQDKGPEQLASHVEELELKEMSGKRIAVQTRKARGEYSFNPIDIKGEIDKLLIEQGAVEEIENP